MAEELQCQGATTIGEDECSLECSFTYRYWYEKEGDYGSRFESETEDEIFFLDDQQITRPELVKIFGEDETKQAIKRAIENGIR
jgi:hypothetical protein